MQIGRTVLTMALLKVLPSVRQTVQISDCKYLGDLQHNAEIYISAASYDAS